MAEHGIVTTVDVPVVARLMLVSEHGNPRPVTGRDLAKLGYVPQLDVYTRVAQALALVATGDKHTDLTRYDGDPRLEFVNLIRYLIEVGLCYEDTPEAVVAHWEDEENPGEHAEKLRAALDLIGGYPNPQRDDRGHVIGQEPRSVP